MKILLLGCGAIGSTVAEGAAAMDHVDAVLAYDVEPARAEELARVPTVRAVRGADELGPALEEADVCVEAASQAAVRELGERVLAAGCDLVVMSVGALADEELRARLAAAARDAGRRVHAPSGALAGLDGVRSAREAELASVVLETRKPLEALPPEEVEGASTAVPTVLFEGTAREAVRRLPKNVNVAAALSLNGVGVDDTMVRVLADPNVRRNSHTVRAAGEFGELTVIVENEPSPTNPATSHLAALSALALVRRLGDPIWVG